MPTIEPEDASDVSDDNEIAVSEWVSKTITLGGLRQTIRYKPEDRAATMQRLNEYYQFCDRGHNPHRIKFEARRPETNQEDPREHGGSSFEGPLCRSERRSIDLAWQVQKLENEKARIIQESRGTKRTEKVYWKARYREEHAQDDVNGQKQFIDESAAEIAHLNEKSKELGGKVAHRDADLKQIRFERSDLQNKSRDRMGEAQDLRGELRKLKKDRGVIGKDFEELLESTDTAAYQGPLEQFKHDQARLAKLKSTFS
ncbi:uncharacterized protein BKA78DRAFT_357869 [Phyllosticta capitalensis]|uniref:uncharacterized protein n=1 Tax=Phyllosticta capitalensis TaxID=121624 RepID=UPI00312E48E0